MKVMKAGNEECAGKVAKQSSGWLVSGLAPVQFVARRGPMRRPNFSAICGSLELK